MIDDKILIARILNDGDSYAYSQLVKKYQSAIRQFLRRLTAGDHHTADDLAQEVFITLYKKINTFRGDSSLSTWLHKIAYNQFLKLKQKAYQKYEQSDHEFDYSHIETLPSNQDKDILIEQLMKKLSADERTCLTLFVNAGLSHPEISTLTKFPLGTVKSHITRAKQKLSQLLLQPMPAAS